MKTRLLLAFTLLLLLLGCAETNRMDNVKFNQEEWSIGDYRTRGNMVENMIEDSILIGKSKMEVLELLDDQGGTSGNFSYPVDLGLQTGPFGLGGVWMFDLNIQFDTLTHKVIAVSCND